MSRALLATVLATSAALGCGDDGTAAPDGGRPDGGRDASTPADDAGRGPLAVALEAPEVAYVGEDACFRAVHTGTAAARVAFLWGDDTRDELTGVADACHSYPYPGDFLVSVVVDDFGESASATAVVPVVFRPSDPLPERSSSIAYDEAWGRVWVVSPDSAAVAVLEPYPPRLLRRLPACDVPRAVAIAGPVVAVVCQGDGALALFDADTLGRVATVDLGAGNEPTAVVADPRGGRVWVSRMAAGDVVAVDVAGATPVAGSPLRVGPDPRGLAMTADGVLLVTRWRSDQSAAHVYQIDASDPEAPVLVGEIALPRQKGLDSDTDNDGVLSVLGQIVLSPDGGRALLPGQKSNVVAGLYRTGLPLTSQTTARAVLAEIMLDADPRTLAVDSYRFSFDDLDHASALVFRPRGDRIYVAIRGAEVVVELDAFGLGITGSIQNVGSAPSGLAISPDGRFLYVDAFLDRAVRVYDVTDLSTEPAPLATIRIVATEPLAADVLEGKRIFHRSRDPRMSRTSYLACASCHPDGEADGLVWDFTQRGEGLRNTIPLRGRGGIAHGPLHWSANFDEVQDFEHDIRNAQGGTGFLPDALFHVGTRDTPLGDPKAGLSPELDALAAYLGSLGSFGTSPHRRDGDAAWEASFARGETLFRSPETGCTACHSGAGFTDSAFESPATPRLHDVGTLGPGSGSRLGGALTGLDTPTLRGLWRSAPYLHDGSAATLRDVLTTRNVGDLHGGTSALTASDLDDLEAFLFSLDDAVP